MTLMSPLWLLAGLLAVPVILLYLLKMKRREVEVSSTLLWVQVLADMRASTPFQKLRRNLLLLLQLLILAALVLALARPLISSGSADQSRQVVIIDASASMQARDVGGDMTRFEAATELAGELIDSLGDSEMMMLIVAGPTGRGLRTGFTYNRHELRTALDEAIETGCYDSPAAVAEAVQLAGSSLRGGVDDEPTGSIVVITDGAGVTLGDQADFEGILRQVSVGSSSANVGIVSLGVETTESARRVVVSLRNFDAGTRKVMVNFYHGRRDNWIDSREIELDAGRRGSVVLERPLAAGRLWVQIAGNEDVFALDDVAYAALPEPRPLSVMLVSKFNPVLARFLAAGESEGRLKATVVEPEAWGPGLEADFTLFDLCAPEGSGALAGDCLFIDPPGPAGPFRPVGVMQAPRPVNSLDEDPILRFVELSGLEVAQARRYEHDGQAVELVSAAGGPLLAYAAHGRSRSYLLSFHLADSTWATDSGILILLSNMLDRAAAAHFVGRGQMVLTGGSADLPTVPASGPVRLAGPGGESITLAAGTRRYAPVDKAGFYSLGEGGPQNQFAANLLNESESDITPRPLVVVTGEQTPTEAAAATVTASRRLWPLLAGAAMAVMLLEWWIFHTRRRA